jgi:thiamine-phosphate diphosphorylase
MFRGGEPLTMQRLRSPIYVIVNHPAPRSAWDVARASLEGGAGLLQFRAKGPLGDDEAAALRTLAGESHRMGVPLLINDSVDLAREVGAAGVHVGQSDAPIALAREALGSQAIIGMTTPTVELAQQAEADGASYVAVGAMYPSPTKPEKPVLGPDRLRAVVDTVSLPVCAIGGITVSRVPELLAAGASLLAVISAVSAADDLYRAVRDLVAACDRVPR